MAPLESLSCFEFHDYIIYSKHDIMFKNVSEIAFGTMKHNLKNNTNGLVGMLNLYMYCILFSLQCVGRKANTWSFEHHK